MNSIVGVIGRGTMWLSSGSVIVKIASLFYLAVLLGNLAVFEYGLSKLALSIPPLLSLLFLGGLQNVLVVDLLSLKREKEFSQMRFLLASFLSAKTIAGLVAFVGLILASFLLQDYFSADLLQLVSVLSVLFLISPVRALVTLSFEVAKNYKLRSWLDVSDEVLKVVIVFILLTVFDFGVLGVILATVASAILSTLLFLPVAITGMKRELGGSYSFVGAKHPFSVFKAHAKWSLFMDSLSSLSLNIRPWIIQFFLGINAVGIYGIAMALLNPLKLLVPIGQVILPIVPQYAKDKAVVIKLINSAIKYKLYIQICLTVVAISLLPALFYFFPEYKEGQWLFIALTSIFIPNAFLQMFNVVFQTYKMQKNMFVAASVNLCIVLFLLPVLIVAFGLYGVAIEMFVTQCIFVYFRLRALRHPLPAYRLPLKELFSITQTDRWLLHKTFHKIFPNSKLKL